MAEAFVELGGTAISHLTDKPIFDKGYHAVTRTTPTDQQSTTSRRRDRRDSPDGSRTIPPGPATAPSVAGSRQRQRNYLPSPERDPDQDLRSQRSAYPARRRDYDDETESEISDRITRTRYEREVDDPIRSPESVLSKRDLARNRGMTSRYGDDYSQAPYRSRSSQPTKSRYYDDDDSDYDERTGRRYGRGSGRGYDDDRDYDVVREETERYRGPPVDRPWDPARKESYRSGYGDGAVTQYGGARRSREDLDDRGTYVSRRSKSRGRDRDRDRDERDYSRSRSGSREGLKEKLGDHFDTSARGLGVGLAGAVIGGLAGREFGHKHKQRDIILGAIVGGLGANAAEHKFRDWKDKKEEKVDQEEERWGQRFDGRSRSNVR